MKEIINKEIMIDIIKVKRYEELYNIEDTIMDSIAEINYRFPIPTPIPTSELFISLNQWLLLFLLLLL